MQGHSFQLATVRQPQTSQREGMNVLKNQKLRFQDILESWAFPRDQSNSFKVISKVQKGKFSTFLIKKKSHLNFKTKNNFYTTKYKWKKKKTFINLSCKKSEMIMY